MTTEEELKAQIERLQAELEALRARGGVQVGDGAAAVGDHNKVVGAGGVLIEGGVYLGQPAGDAVRALEIYRRVLVQTTTNLPLRGVDVGAADPTSAQKTLGLLNVYVNLDTTSQVEIKAKGEGRRDRVDFKERGESRPLSALEAAISNKRLVLLGDPGSGKTTFVNYLTHCLAANALEPDGGWMEHLPGWPAEENQLLPVIVILRDFARSLPNPLPDRAEPHHIWDFIAARLQVQKLEFAADAIHQKLEKGQALLLLDGLDEVPNQEQRIIVRDAVRAFMQRYADNRFLITCRILSYQPPRSNQEPDLRLTELRDFTLAPFDEEKIDAFIQGWYTELGRLGSVSSSDVQDLSLRLQAGLHRPDLWRLASTPLLLTVMALVHTHKGRLPEARALLYEETVDILLWRWEQVKLTGRSDTPHLQQLLLEAGRSDVDLKRILWELAYEAHEQAGGDSGEDQLAGIGELRLQKALAGLKDGDANWARQVIEAIKLRAGLLLERSAEVFTFPHRTFQEYLAGAHLAAQANFARKASELAAQGAQWREVILLAVGRLVYHVGDQDKPLALAGELCPGQVTDDDILWQKSWLAGDVLLEVGVTRVQDSALGRDLLLRVRERLVELVAGGKLAPIERARTGNTLAQLGDPRFDPRRWHLPAEPMLGFIEIPGGPFLMGSDSQSDPDSFGDETPQHEVVLPTYYIARYPVTVAQFKSFVEDSAYQPSDSDSLRGHDNHPVVWVSWQDALAYCRWLQDQFSKISEIQSAQTGMDAAASAFWDGFKQGSLRIILPSEAEWEKAARGGAGRLFPWGSEYDPGKANLDETGIGNTSAVGCFPMGASPYGVEELSGNVSEWSRSLWGTKWDKPDYPYPYDPNDGREEINTSSDVHRVQRGGSFNDLRGFARCASRFRYRPGYRNLDFGFRVVVSPSGGA